MKKNRTSHAYPMNRKNVPMDLPVVFLTTDPILHPMVSF